jgi:hypothetical protein
LILFFRILDQPLWDEGLFQWWQDCPIGFWGQSGMSICFSLKVFLSSSHLHLNDWLPYIYYLTCSLLVNITS